MELSDYFPIWNELSDVEREQLSQAAVPRTFKKGAIVSPGKIDCLGLLLVRSGQLRAYLRSTEGREFTIYRLLERDICLFSASCIMNGLQFELAIEAEKDTELLIIPSEVYQSILNRSAPLANYTNEIMASRFSDVMWLMEQILWKRMDRRLAAFLLEESSLEGEARLPLTHERIGNHLGTAREVITRMLRYFQAEGLVKLARGVVVLTDFPRLRALSEDA